MLVEDVTDDAEIESNKSEPHNEDNESDVEEADPVENNNSYDAWTEDIVITEDSIDCIEQNIISMCMDKCRNLVKMISKSTILNEYVSRLKQEYQVTQNLAIDCRTRW